MSAQPQTAMEILKHQDKITVTPEQVALARQTVASNLDDNQFALFCYNCSRLGVHPLDGLLVPIVRTDNDEKRRLTFVNTVDLLRSRADATGDYAGSDDPVFEYHMKNDVNCPSDAQVTVWKFVQGTKCSFTATARWEEYYPGEKQGFMWRNKPHVMLGKCAEALALRKAFPKQLSGLYIPEELQKEIDSHTGPAPQQKHSGKKAPAPTGDVMCAECRAINGHLPSCSYRKKQEGKSTVDHQESTVDPKADKKPLTWLVNVEAIDVRTKVEKDKKGDEKTRHFRLLTCRNIANESVTLYAFHMFERLDKIKPNTKCIFTVKPQETTGKTFFCIDTIVEITGEKKLDSPQGELLAPHAEEEF